MKTYVIIRPIVAVRTLSVRRTIIIWNWIKGYSLEITVKYNRTRCHNPATEALNNVTTGSNQEPCSHQPRFKWMWGNTLPTAYPRPGKYTEKHGRNEELVISCLNDFRIAVNENVLKPSYRNNRSGGRTRDF